MPFEWDSKKYETNLQKHNIDFYDVADSFESAHVEWASDQNGENRKIRIVQLSNSKIVTVFYTIRGENIRVISARKARPDERRKFDNL